MLRPKYLELCIALLILSPLLLRRCGGLPNPGSPKPLQRHACKPVRHRSVTHLRRLTEADEEKCGATQWRELKESLRGGMDDAEASPVVSTMAIPGMGESHAFAPLEEHATKMRKPRKFALERVLSMPSLDMWKVAANIFERRSPSPSPLEASNANSKMKQGDMSAQANMSSSAQGLDAQDDSKYAWFYPDPPWGRKQVFRPGSKFLQVWDCILWVAMVYMAWHVPFHAAGFVAYDSIEDLSCLRGAGGGVSIFALINSLSFGQEHRIHSFVDSIFLSDMFVSLHTGVYVSSGSGHHRLIDDLPSIRKHYLASRQFVCDVFGVLPLRMSACLIAAILPHTLRPPNARFLSLVRMFRMAKLLRLHRLNRISNFIKLRRLHRLDRISNVIKYTFPKRSRVLELVALLLQMLFTGHLLACLWYYIGTSDPEKGWVAKQMAPAAGIAERYIASIYFVFSTITTVGYGDLTGLTTSERLFCVCAMVLGGFLFGLLIGSLPKILDRRSVAGGRYLRLEELLETALKDYLKDKAVPPTLHARILQFFEYRYPERRSFDGHAIIADLPVSLQKDLAAHVYRHVVSSCPILRRCSPATTGQICLALRRVFAGEGDVISREGTQSTGLYIIVCGQVALSQGWECKVKLGAGGALGDNAVMGGDGSGTVWYTATALEPTEMVVILRNDFEDLVANRGDFVATYNLETWDKVKSRILQRRNHRLGLEGRDQVVAQLSDLRETVRQMILDQRELVDKEKTREAIKTGVSYSHITRQSSSSSFSSSD